ncbi:MAG: DRTGG domain-containing protein [Nitrospirota bacterium]
MELQRIVELVEGKIVVSGRSSPGSGVSVTSVYSTDLMSDVLHYAIRGSLLITGLNQSQVIRSAEIADIPAVLVTQDKRIDREMAELARAKDITIISTRLPMFTVCGILYEQGLRSSRE